MAMRNSGRTQTHTALHTLETLLLGTPAAQVSRATKVAIQLVRVKIAALVRSEKWPARLQFTPRQMARLAKIRCLSW
jgi:hypothetical protein